MSKRKKRKRRKGGTNGLKAETRHSILAIVFFVLAIFLMMSAFRATGVAGQVVYGLLESLLGVGYMLLPILFIMLGASFIRSNAPEVDLMRGLSSVAFLLTGLAIIDIISKNQAGGFLGKILSKPLVALFDIYASVIFLAALLVISILVMFDSKLAVASFLQKLFGASKNSDSDPEVIGEYDYDEETEEEGEDYDEDEPEVEEELKVNKNNESEEGMPIKKSRRRVLASEYIPLPLSLLEGDKGKPNTGNVKANAMLIKRTLQNFGIEVEMDEITIGPTVTRYALKPAEGVKLSRIMALQKDLALALAAHPLRIEAPIPGKSLVGIEIPNKTKSLVGLANILSDKKFQETEESLVIALGRSISGKAIFGNLAKMPHLLVAGATGSGKSVSIHSLITSLLYRNGPDDLKFIMVDPKRVELTLYKKIPHLLTPVITDAKKTILALKWAAKEMDRRYDILEEEAVRDVESYHKNVVAKSRDEETDRMPYIVIIIDELADIMTAYPRELESAIVRLAQMSRAVGIHLILSTQRPEVNVITGLIKANIPARIALKVSSQVDSRTILDSGGAEKLLGAGDMLYSSGHKQPERLQSAFISETEVKKVVKYLADNYEDEFYEDIAMSEGAMNADRGIFESTLEDEEEDELYEDARICVVEAGKGSTSYLQRKLGIGYARAARIMDMLEERRVVGPADGSKPREVLEKIERNEETGDLPAGRQEI